jgi:hypothetical protein
MALSRIILAVSGLKGTNSSHADLPVEHLFQNMP